MLHGGDAAQMRLETLDGAFGGVGVAREDRFERGVKGVGR